MTAHAASAHTRPVVVLLTVVAALALWVGTPSTSGTLVGRVTNAGNTAASAIFAAATCAAVARTSGAYSIYPLHETGGTTMTDVSGNARTGSYVTPAGVTYGTAGPCPRDGARAITLNGTTGQMRAPAMSSPQVFSTQVWFRTTTTRGGMLIGYGNGTAGTGPSGLDDRSLFMGDTGQLGLVVQPQGNRRDSVTTPGSYNDGAWHQAVATLAPAGDANPGLRLYVDGALVVADPLITSARVDPGGVWRIGFDELKGYVPAATSNFFAGSLAFVSVYGTALTPTEVRAHFNAGR